ncbi:MAG: dTDP-4-dehydrorhamnose 3,5-epimerase family protein [Ilumatobacteraceae bacterium]
MVDGVVITPLRQISDERGKVMHMLRATDPIFIAFGEIYFSCVYPNAIKAWHRHKQMTLNYAVPHGRIKFVLYDDRKDSTTVGQVQEIYLGEENYCLVTVPPLVWNGFTGLGTEMAIVANCASMPHDPNEIERLDPFDELIPYDWTLKHQ